MGREFIFLTNNCQWDKVQDNRFWGTNPLDGVDGWSCSRELDWDRGMLKVWRAETGAWLTRGGTQTSDVNTRVRSCYESSIYVGWAFLWLKCAIDMQQVHFANEGNAPKLAFFPVIKYWSQNNEPFVREQSCPWQMSLPYCSNNKSFVHMITFQYQSNFQHGHSNAIIFPLTSPMMALCHHIAL